MTYTTIGRISHRCEFDLAEAKHDKYLAKADSIDGVLAL